jgi:hypothetical protein
MPAIVDSDGPGGKPIQIFASGAILSLQLVQFEPWISGDGDAPTGAVLFFVRSRTFEYTTAQAIAMARRTRCGRSSPPAVQCDLAGLWNKLGIESLGGVSFNDGAPLAAVRRRAITAMPAGTTSCYPAFDSAVGPGPQGGEMDVSGSLSCSMGRVNI